MSGRRFALALLAALLLAACDARKESTFQGWVEAELIFVGPDEAGRVETLTVREGDQVERGMLLFTIDPDLQQADVAMQEAAVKNAQQAYDRAQQLLKTQAGRKKPSTTPRPRCAPRRRGSTRRRPGSHAAKSSAPSPARSSRSITAGASWSRPANRSSRCCPPAT
jgi:multidrug resistance efflux pump